MTSEEIESLIKQNVELDEVRVKTDGSHVEVIAVGEVFAGLSRVKQQQTIYKPLMDKIKDGTLHAVTIKAFTPEKWEREKKLIFPS